MVSSHVRLYPAVRGHPCRMRAEVVVPPQVGAGARAAETGQGRLLSPDGPEHEFGRAV